MSKLDDFILQIKTSLMDNGYETISIAKEKRFYYANEEYGDPLKKCFDAIKAKSKEFNPTPHYTNYKICSVSSSARLCFLYLLNKYGKDNVQFEIQLPNPAAEKDKNFAQPDAKAGKVYFECKCQEIINGEGETLSVSYIPFLKTHFGIENIKINQYEGTISANLKDLNIDYDEDYDKTHFNFKQLFTHLIAIAEAHSNKEDIVELQYIFFVPCKSKMNDETRTVFRELHSEIAALFESKALATFYERHKNIKLSNPVLEIEVDDKCFANDPKELLVELRK